MKLKRSSARPRVRASLEIVPLIDVVLLLVFFFVLGVTFVRHSAIPIAMSETEAPGSFLAEGLSITLSAEPGGPDGQGKIYVDDLEVQAWDDLSARLSAYHANQPDATVLVRPDRDVSTGRTVQVMGIVTGAGITHYFIAAEPPRPQE
ncbi:MAG: biopolymer transporter ExbD [Candidatus Hydrogenedentes bacterium]|nr:biopolymer transporter ExbD [Candidatus Hydrogenedentota bacterium]